MNSFQHFTQGKRRNVKFRIVICEPLQHRRCGAGFRRLTENVGVNEVGPGALMKKQVAGRGGIALEFPAFHRAIPQDLNELFVRLQPGIRL